MALSDFTTPISTWSQADVLHLARRAGFGVSPEHATTLAAQAPAAVIDGWIDGTLAAVPGPSAAASLFQDALANRADLVSQPLVKASTTVAGAVDVPAVAAPHPFLTEGANAWRNSLSAAQAQWLWRMQYNPFPFRERLALFFHNLFATGWHKVDNAALMLKQIELLRSFGAGSFEELLVSVSKDPAMGLWLDSINNNAAGSSVPNENYAREVMELYSLGVDNGYNQADITQLARALSGWSFVIPQAAMVTNPSSPNQRKASDAVFTVYSGQATPTGSLPWWGSAATKLPRMHPTGVAGDTSTIDLQWQSGLNIVTTTAGQAPGENALRSILSGRAVNCSQFLARRLLVHFVTGSPEAQDVADFASIIRTANFNLGSALKILLKSSYFFAPDKRFALVEGPVSWVARAARALCQDLATADAATPRGFPAWRAFTGQGGTATLDQMGMRLLDPSGPNGWKEDKAWLTSNTVRYRAKVAAALALGETTNTGLETLSFFPTQAASWFPVAPASAQAVLDRLLLLLQPGPLPASVTAGWLAALWPSGFTWDAASQTKARELAFLILCSPAGQLY